MVIRGNNVVNLLYKNGKKDRITGTPDISFTIDKGFDAVVRFIAGYIK
jgi:hypothetical protein